MDKDDIKNIIENAEPYTNKDIFALTPAPRGRPPKHTKSSTSPKDYFAENLLTIMKEHEFWSSGDGQYYVTYLDESIWKHSRVEDESYRIFLSAEFYKRFNNFLKDDVFQRVLPLRIKGATIKKPWIRFGHDENTHYIDLKDGQGGLIKIDRSGCWYVKNDGSQPFISGRNMLELKRPADNANLKLLDAYLNLENPNDILLIYAYLIMVMWSQKGPYPILIFQGEQGTGKSLVCKLLKRLIDPSIAPLLSIQNEQNMMISAQNAALLAYDNISKLSGEMSDNLCKLATGMSISSRLLYSNSSEAILTACRPILLNGIPSLTNRDDFADRAIVVHLRPLEDTERKPEEELFHEFEKDCPFILAGLLEIMTKMKRVTRQDMPNHKMRMADYVKIGVMLEQILALKEGSFLQAYQHNMECIREDGLENNMVAALLIHFILDCPQKSWKGQIADLIGALTEFCIKTGRNPNIIPTSAQMLGNILTRSEKVLRSKGIYMLNKHSGARIRTIYYKM